MSWDEEDYSRVPESGVRSRRNLSPPFIMGASRSEVFFTRPSAVRAGWGRQGAVLRGPRVLTGRKLHLPWGQREGRGPRCVRGWPHARTHWQDTFAATSKGACRRLVARGFHGRGARPGNFRRDLQARGPGPGPDSESGGGCPVAPFPSWRGGQGQDAPGRFQDHRTRARGRFRRRWNACAPVRNTRSAATEFLERSGLAQARLPIHPFARGLDSI